MAAVTICSGFGAQENKISHCFHCFSSVCHEVMGPDTMIFVFWMLSFKPAFSLSFIFIKSLFSSSFSAIRLVSSAHLRLLIFLPAILIPPCASSSPAFLMTYSAYKLNKQGDSIQPWCTSFPIWNQVVVPYLVLTVASWPVYRFLRRQVRWSGIPISKNFPQLVVIHTVKGFGIGSKAEVDVFLELSFFLWSNKWWIFFFSFWMLVIWTLFPLPFRNPVLTPGKFLVHVLLKPRLENFEHVFASVWDECSCVVVWTFFGIAFLWDWNENWLFPVLWPLLGFPNLLAHWVQDFHSIIF